ncbi:uncharacterized protein LOC135466053 [Liolophura sinensis]|uniref:uncharacterized protein LOC135466053 n=1 Tax=Liolophura sinensis TaxID=3198878 RepID=UPI0031587139
MEKFRFLLSMSLAFVCVFGCVFIVKSLQQDTGLLDKQLSRAKKKIMENTSWKLDTYLMFKMFDGNGDGKLNKNELNAMLLVATMDIKEAEATAGTLAIVGDTDDDNQLTVKEFSQMFGIKGN